MSVRLALGVVAAALAAGGLAIAQQSVEGVKEPNAEPKTVVEPPAPPPPKINPADVTDVPAPDATPAPVRPAAPSFPPDKRPRYPIAIMQALDKITAQTLRFEAPVGQPVRWRNLIVTVRSCEATAQDEVERDAMAHVEIAYLPTTPAGQQPSPAKAIYRGWMFAASPSITPLEHPTYDAWLIACKAAAPATTPRPVTSAVVKLPPKPAEPAARPDAAPLPKVAPPSEPATAAPSRPEAAPSPKAAAPKPAEPSAPKSP